MAGIRALLGFFPKTSIYETKRLNLEDEYNELISFRNSKELRHFQELEAEIQSDKFKQKKHDIHALRYKNTEDFQKEKRYQALKKSGDVKLYLKTLNGPDLPRFQKIEKSDTLKKYRELEDFVNSEEFRKIKKEASASSKQKFRRSDLATTLDQYNSQRKSARIKGYQRFVRNKNFAAFEQAIKEGIPEKAAALTSQKDQDDAGKELLKSALYKAYKKLAGSPDRKYYDELHGSAEIEAFNDLANFIQSDDFKRQKKEIESKGFKDTDAYTKLQEYQQLSKSDDIRFYKKFGNSKALKNYNALHGSEKIKELQELESFIESDEFKRFREYATQSPAKRWKDSREYEKEQEYETLKKSEKIKWYFSNIDSPKFAWHRAWSETFSEDFSAKTLDKKKWMTRYYYGEELLKDSYSLSSDKHFVTDGKNLELDGSKLVISVRKENVKGKSWDKNFGFVTRDFGYTSGLITTGKSLRQQYGTFEAKIRISDTRNISNTFWMEGKKQLPHITIMRANKNLYVGSATGENDAATGTGLKNYAKKYKRSKFQNDYFIYTLEWTPEKLIWKINGVEIAETTSTVPAEPMYLLLGSGLHKDLDGASLPSRMEIDWVRCYQRNDLAKK